MCLPPSTQRGRTLQLGPSAYGDHPRYISPPQLGIALQLGPDFLLAPAGLVADKGGLRPGRLLEEAIGALVSPEAQWLRDRREELAASAPLAIRALVFVIFAAAALPVRDRDRGRDRVGVRVRDRVRDRVGVRVRG